MTFIKTAILLFSILLGGNLQANALNEIKGVRIIIENLDEDAAKCGITEDQLDASVRIPLSTSRINTLQSSSFLTPYLYVNANVISGNEACVASISVEFKRYVSEVQQFGTFWEKSGVMRFNKNIISKRLEDEVNSYAKQFIAAWLKQNGK